MHANLPNDRPAGQRSPRAGRLDAETQQLMAQARALLGKAPAAPAAPRVARRTESAGYTVSERDAAVKALTELNENREARRVASPELVLAEQAVKSAMVNHAARSVRRSETKKAAKGHRVRWPERYRPRRAAWPNRDLTLLTEADAAELARRGRNYAPSDLAKPGERARFANPGPIAGFPRADAARVERELKRRAKPYRPERVPVQSVSRERTDVCPACNIGFSLAGWCECERTEPVPAPKLPAPPAKRPRAARKPAAAVAGFASVTSQLRAAIAAGGDVNAALDALDQLAKAQA